MKQLVLVTGANGQLGQELSSLSKNNLQITALGHGQLDVTNLDQCKRVIADLRPHSIIHTAAYTAVDKAESDPDEAYKVNAVGTRNLALAARAVDAKICYISTDYVFDGAKNGPYNEYDDTSPQTVYGKSKRAGEVLLQSLSNQYYIVRTSWVFGKFGNNFVKTMLKLARENESLTVVDDQIGSPTYTRDLSNFIVELIQTEAYGIYHASNTGSCSWYEFAKAIFEESGTEINLLPCTTQQFPRPAKRPMNSILDHSAIRQNGFKDLPHWRVALKDFLDELNKD